MRLVFRAGSFSKADAARASASGESVQEREDEGFSVQPSLTISPTAAATTGTEPDSSELFQKDVKVCSSQHSGAKQCRPITRETARRSARKGIMAFFCSFVLLASVVAMIKEARSPIDCVPWSEKLHVPRSLKVQLNSALFGQDVAKDVVLDRLSLFLSDTKKRKKPLVLLFFGPRGTGKTLAGEIVGQILMSRSSSVNMKSHAKRYAVPDYHSDVPSDSNLTLKLGMDYCLCHKGNVFLLDDLDLPGKSQWLRGLLPLLSGSRSYGDCPPMDNAVVILTMQEGAQELISRREALLESGVGESQFQSTMKSDAGAVFRTAVADNRHVTSIVDAVDAFVPFLPMEQVHVEACVERELTASGLAVSSAAVQSVLSLVEFSNASSPAVPRFATNGCKKVATRVLQAHDL